MGTNDLLFLEEEELALHSVCRVRGCANPARAGECCPRCREEIDAMNARELELQGRRKRRGSDAERRLRRAKRLEGFAYASAATLVLWYLLWESRVFWIDCFQMWFGHE